MCVTDIRESDENLQAAASTPKRTTPIVLPGAKLDDDDDLDDDLGVQSQQACAIHNNLGDLLSQLRDEDRLDVATEN